MPYISDKIDNLIQGVSQQAAAARRSTQSESELNTMSSAVEGLGKRPPAEFIASLVSTTGRAFVHWINRDRLTQFAVIISDETLKVFNAVTGAEEASFAVGPGHPLYNAAADKSSLYVAHTAADTTFLANALLPVAASASVQPARPYEAVINVRAGGFSADYEVKVNGVSLILFRTPNSGEPDSAKYVGTDQIAEFLVDPSTAPANIVGTTSPAGATNGLDGPGLSSLSGSGYTVVRNGSVIYLSHPSVDFSVDVYDDQGSNAMTASKGSVNKFSDLPKDSPVDGFVIKITGDDQNPYDDYFVRWDNTLNSWIEAPAPGSSIGLDPATMPYILQRTGPSAWTLGVGAWVQRGAGSEDSNEDPPFVGNTISTMTDNDGRFAIGAGEDLYWSKARDIYAFFRETVTQYLPDDPFGVVCSGDDESVSAIRSVVKFSERLLVVSDSFQNVVVSGDTFGYGSVRAVPTTAIAVDPRVPVLLLKSDLLLATDRGQWTGVSQLFIDGLSAAADVDDVTEHVPKYIPNGLHTFTGSKTEGMVFAAGELNPTSIYVWRYILRNRERAQSAWTKWEIECDRIVSAKCFGSILKVVASRNDTLHLLSVDLSAAASDPDQEYRSLIDWRVAEGECTAVYDLFTDTTTITHPLALDGLIVVSRGLDEVPGELADADSNAPGETVVKGDWSARLFYAGTRYRFEYEFSKIFPRDREGAARQDGRLQLAHLYVDFSKTGYFQAIVKPQGRPARTRTFEGRYFDSPDNVTDEVALASGRFSIPVISNAATTVITLVNDSHFPSNFSLAEWEGSFNSKARRLR